MTYFEKLEQAAARNASRLCVGLDPDPDRIPNGEISGYLREIIAATHDLVCCYKPNLAFFEALGPDGIALLRETRDAIPKDIPILADAKRGDIGNTAAAYARALFDAWEFDAATVNAYGGHDTIEPFLAYADRGVYVWCRSSNPGAGDFQDLLMTDQSGEQRPLYEVIATSVSKWNTHGNAALVAGATYPEQIARLRSLCPDLPFLLPGVGAQGAALRDAVQAARFPAGGGFIVNASRGVLYAAAGPDFAEAARREAVSLRDAIAAAERAPVAG
ncbi:MAG: orotidine-5'-phosphate decarboxylase [Dehalococcoidia bacterium]